MYKVKLTLNRLAALAATTTFCLLATACGDDAEKKEDGDRKTAEATHYKTTAEKLKADLEKYTKLSGKELLDKIVTDAKKAAATQGTALETAVTAALGKAEIRTALDKKSNVVLDFGDTHEYKEFKSS